MHESLLNQKMKAKEALEASLKKNAPAPAAAKAGGKKPPPVAPRTTAPPKNTKPAPAPVKGKLTFN